ncbi:MAG TPA: energy transducer TonB [Pyrinomonadaceae bacterium]|nr:energy transducer TonB [Pyrinomonadaceae bacterium]
MKAFSTLFLMCVIAAGAAIAQEAPRTISAGVLNGKAISLPQPEYPESARLADIGGTVRVDVVIDEGGGVVSAIADTMDQHEVYDANGIKLAPAGVDPALREAAEKAARQARFAPVLIAGKSVQLKGALLYSFVSDKSERGPRVGRIYGPLLNNQTEAFPQPVYPEAARAARAQGEVTVHVTIDPEGKVTAAEATSGHPLLRAAAVEAALHAKFKPSLLAGQPTRNSGVLSYTFSMTAIKVVP